MEAVFESLPRAGSPFPHVLGGGSGDGRAWQIFEQNGTLSGRFRIEGEGVVVVAALSAGRHDVALRFDGTTVALFIDGVVVGTESPTGSVVEPVGPLAIGANANLADRHFLGVIDEVRIAAEAHSDAWIAVQHQSFLGDLLVVGPEESLEP